MPTTAIHACVSRMSWLLTILIFLMTCGARTATAAEPTVNADRPDPHSYGRPDQVRVTDVDLRLVVDFAQKRLHGMATLTFERQPGTPASAPLILDARGLKIIEITSGLENKHFWNVPWSEGPADPILGRAVIVDLAHAAPTAEGMKFGNTVTIEYETVPDAGALQWLDPKQTAGGTKPFLFTQSEAIQARTWIPTQDSPGVRTTFDATVLVPEGLTAVMAADSVPIPAGEDRLGDKQIGPARRYDFRMDQPIPSYLIALAVGDLAFQPLGPRTGVWAEPSVLAKAAHEFADTEKMVEATEARFGPYRWGRYDLLVLPPSFPFGGMENPKLTFATPTILAGDRSLVALVAHELAHSWSGNLVTNATWNDFWLNEGFTVYLERRIVEAVYGADRRQMEQVLGIGELRADLARLDARDQRLQLDLKGRDPDDGMNQVAYEKGALFLTELELIFGRVKFDPFLKSYFDAHAFQSITTADFVAYLRQHLLGPNPDLANQVDLDAWIHQPGLAAKFTEPRSARLEAVDGAAKAFATGEIAAANLPTADWTTQEWLQFLRQLPDPLSPVKMTELDAAFDLTGKQNAEIAGQWLLMAARSGYGPADARIESFLMSVGRRKFIIPIYRALIQTPAGAERARVIFARARAGYHPIAAESVAKLLGR